MKITITPVNKTIEQLIKLYPPKLASQIKPEWYKNMSLRHDLPYEATDGITAKKCPAIQDVINKGFIIPIWGNLQFKTAIRNGINDQRWFLSTALNYDYPLEWWIQEHNSEQLEGMDINRIYSNGILKVKCPYHIQVPEGYGLMYSDPFYHFRNDIRCLTGIVDTDDWGFITFPFEVLKDNFEIKAGTPLVHVYPYKLEDEKLELETRYATDKEYEEHAFKFLQHTAEGTHYKNRKEPFKKLF